jgi:ribosomal protein L24E
MARRVGLLTTIVMLVAGTLVGLGPAPAGAAANGWPHSVVNGFSTPTGNGYWLVYADGTVTPHGGAGSFGDASNIALNGPIVGGAATPDGKGYWLVAQDGGIFTFGDAHFYGSMGAAHLNEPVFSMSPTKDGKGYWLVARDGGIFTFGDAKFYGSAGSLVLNEPITGITTSPSGKGYRMVATDGGIFSFGDVPYYGSLPGLGINVNDVIGNAPIPSNAGYWVARSTGQVYSFGHAHPLGSYPAVACNPIAAIFSNPAAQGYRLVTESGATIPFGAAPGGSAATGDPKFCPNPPTMSLAEYNTIQVGYSYEQVVSLVAGPGVLISQSTVVGNVTRTYKWIGEGLPGANANVTFRNDHAISKSQFGLG